MVMGYSTRCRDPTTRWDRSLGQCVKCQLQPGHEITPNCGFDDDGGRHDIPLKRCKSSTFNNGSWPACKPCAQCPPGSTVIPCTLTADTQCQPPSKRTTQTPAKEPTTSQPGWTFVSQASTIQAKQRVSSTHLPTVHSQLPSVSHGAQWVVPLLIFISVMLVMLSAFLVFVKRKRGQGSLLKYNRGSFHVNAGFSPLPAPLGNNDMEDILSPCIMSAPLQTVLDNLDVLEELVILLDPETHGVKNTKHLASHCSFPSTWITYTYSLKDSKSPLKAVLEGITSRHPEWTVGHLVGLLQKMERNDAITALGKLRPNKMDV